MTWVIETWIVLENGLRKLLLRVRRVCEGPETYRPLLTPPGPGLESLTGTRHAPPLCYEKARTKEREPPWGAASLPDDLF